MRLVGFVSYDIFKVLKLCRNASSTFVVFIPYDILKVLNQILGISRSTYRFTPYQSIQFLNPPKKALTRTVHQAGPLFSKAYAMPHMHLTIQRHFGQSHSFLPNLF